MKKEQPPESPFTKLIENSLPGLNSAIQATLHLSGRTVTQEINDDKCAQFEPDRKFRERLLHERRKRDGCQDDC